MTTESKKSPSARGTPAGSPDFVYLNGIDPETGMYAVQPLSIDELAKGVRAGAFAPAVVGSRPDRLRSFAAPFGVDLEEVEETGWGIVYPEDTPAEVRAALTPLVEHRRARAGGLLKVLDHKRGEQVGDWCFRHGVAAGTLTPRRVPYYLLIVGPPTEIPFEFQHSLGAEYAVGRLDFDRPLDYEQYARSVVAYENAGVIQNAREVVFWGTQHPGDPATRLSSTALIEPLANGNEGSEEPAIHAEVGYKRRLYFGDEATRRRLVDSLRGHEPPALLFAASHGLAIRPGRPKQAARQGSLLCQDWPGFGRVRRDHYVAAEDIPANANVSGMVAVLFACFGAGTPATDPLLDAVPRDGEAQNADQPFVSALARRLLSHPGGSALAVVGHLDRAWGLSIQSPGANEAQLVAFRNSLGYILKGSPVGHVVTRQFGHRHAALTAGLLGAVSTAAPPAMRPSDRDLVTHWLERNDARGIAVLGDPAVRIREANFA